MDFDSYLARQVDEHTDTELQENLQEYIDANYEEIIDDVYYDDEDYFRIDWDNVVYINDPDGGFEDYKIIIEDDFYEIINSLSVALNKSRKVIKELKDELKEVKK